MLTHFEKLDETLFTKKLANGLTVKVVKKSGFTRTLAYFATDFGSIHRDFTLDGQEYHVPAGVAHFLEHKLFELPERDVTAEFGVLGANVNAFTSFDMTAYYFSATANFEAALRLLLEFVSTPYFPADSVRREMGIIDQEIAMNEDDPGSREFELLMTGMYRHHPVRVPILGTRESIREITPEILHLCHRAFYCPANMVLTVVGDVDGEAVAALAEEVLGREYRAPGVKIKNWPEEMVCHRAEAAQQMDVNVPSYQIGFKCEPAGTGAEALRADVVGYLAAEVLLGESSPLYLELYEAGLIDSSFGGGFETIDGCAMLTCGGDGENAPVIRDALLAAAAKIAGTGVDEAELLRLKRGAMGRRLRDLDSFAALCYRICAYHFLGLDYFNFPEIYGAVTAHEVRTFLERTVKAERCSISVTTTTAASL